MSALAELAIAADPCACFAASGMVPDAWQTELMRTNEWALALCSRQAGKTETGAALALHTAVSQPGSLTLLTAPTDRQATEAFRRVATFYRAAFGWAVGDDALTKRQLETASGSRVVAISGHDDSNLRVFSDVSLLVFDEACRVKDSVIHGLLPMLAVSEGRAVFLTTAWFRRGYFYENWTDGGDGFARFEVTADQVSRISPEFLERERRSKPRFVFAQEYECRWGADGDAAFDYEFVEAAMRDDLELYTPDRQRLL